MWKLVSLLALVTVLVATPASAARQKWVGTVASNLGGFVRVVIKLQPVTATTAVGVVRCLPGTLRCLAKRGGATLTLTSPTTFEAILRFTNGVACAAAGSATSFSLQGNYGCLDPFGQLADSGVFQLTRRH